MKKRIAVFIVLILAVFLVWELLYPQAFPRQTDGRDSTAYRVPAVRRWGIAIVGKGPEGLWHILTTDSSGALYTVTTGKTVTAIYDTTVTATTTQDTIVIVEGKADYFSIAVKESFVYSFVFATTHDSASTYVPPGVVHNVPVYDDSVFIKMEEGTSLFSIVGYVY